MAYLFNRILFLFFACICTLTAQASNVSLFDIANQPLTYAKEVHEATYLTLNTAALKQAYQANQQTAVFTLPINQNRNLTLNLQQFDILAKGFNVQTGNNQKVPYQKGLYYRGTVQGETKSIVTISVFGDMVMGLITLADGSNYVLGEIEDARYSSRTDYILYNDRNLLITNNYNCETDNIPQPFYNPNDLGINPHQIDNSRALTDTVMIYFQCDYHLYQNKGSVANATNYATGLFNQVATLYANENINIAISEIYVWSSNDPYTTSSSSAALDAFQAQLNGNFNGDVAHLLSTEPSGNGGVAYLNVLCDNKYWAVGYSNINSYYSAVPTFSWTVECVTHELGHNLGSPHTQACVWGTNGNQALDNCYYTEGSCRSGPAPSNGGTIMSYCHLTSYGINLNNGFGTQPGNLIRSRVGAASCLSGTGGSNPQACTDTYESNEKRTTAKTIPKSTTISAKIGSSTDRDWFKFSITSTKDITVTLSNVAADYDMVVYKGTTQVGISENSYPYNETVFLDNATSGTYYIGVYGWNGQYNATLCYNLLASIANPLLPLDDANKTDLTSQFTVFPNPVNNMATLQLTTNNDTQAKIVLTDLSGRIVSQQTTKLYAGKNQTNIDTQTLPNGMYLVTIDYNGSRVTQKMLVQH